MKLSTFTFGASLLLASGFAAAKVSYVSGTFDNFNPEKQTISIVKDRTGKLTTYKYADEADFKSAFGRSLELSAFERGQPVTLKIQAPQK